MDVGVLSSMVLLAVYQYPIFPVTSLSYRFERAADTQREAAATMSGQALAQILQLALESPSHDDSRVCGRMSTLLTSTAEGLDAW